MDNIMNIWKHLAFIKHHLAPKMFSEKIGQDTYSFSLSQRLAWIKLPCELATGF